MEFNSLLQNCGSSQLLRCPVRVPAHICLTGPGRCALCAAHLAVLATFFYRRSGKAGQDITRAASEHRPDGLRLEAQSVAENPGRHTRGVAGGW
jgi:hypothetical protein